MPHKPGHERRELAATASEELGFPYRPKQQGVRRNVGAASLAGINPVPRQLPSFSGPITREAQNRMAGRAAESQLPLPAPASAPPSLRRQSAYNVLPGADPNRVEFTDSRNDPTQGFGTIEASGIRERLAAGRGTVTSLPAEDFIRSGYDASAVTAARQAAMQRGDLGAVRRSLMSPEERAADDEKKMRASLRRQAAGNGRGLNQTPSQAFADLQQRRAARRELDRLQELDIERGRNETQLAGEGLRRVTAQEKADQAARLREQDLARENLKRQHSDEEGNIRDPFAYSFDEARLLASSDEDPNEVFRLGNATGKNLRFQAEERVRKLMNEDRGRLFNLPRRINEAIHGRNTEVPLTTLDPSFEGMRIDDQGMVRIPLGANGDARISMNRLKDLDPALAEYVSILVSLDNPQAR